MNEEPSFWLPTHREQIDDWLRQREQLYPGVPLSAREYEMLKKLRANRPPYSLT